jgi:hypothetical protein
MREEAVSFFDAIKNKKPQVLICPRLFAHFYLLARSEYTPGRWVGPRIIPKITSAGATIFHWRVSNISYWPKMKHFFTKMVGGCQGIIYLYCA